RKIFAVRKSEPSHWRRRPQRLARCRGGEGPAGIRRAHIAGHTSPRTASDLLYKNALDDRARTIFGGLIRVEPHAHFTDAYQKVRNLLLSDDAEANSMPGLEILADNVRCTHGATSGQVDEEELFYLR